MDLTDTTDLTDLTDRTDTTGIARPDGAGNPAARRLDDPEALGAMDRLLDAELDYRIGARSGFINHLAMSLVAAARLGATADELQRWYDEQTRGDFLLPRVRQDALAVDAERIAEASSSAKLLIRSLFTVVRAVSAEEKKADKINVLCNYISLQS